MHSLISYGIRDLDSNLSVSNLQVPFSKGNDPGKGYEVTPVVSTAKSN